MATPLHQRNPCSGNASILGKAIRIKPNVACFTGALNAAVPGEAESTGSGGLEDPRQRQTAATMDPEDADLSQARQKPPKRAWRHDQ
jgi:hypothetical protein